MNELVMKYKSISTQYAALKEHRDALEHHAKIGAKRQMWMGLVVIGGHFCFVGTGTYYVWSWDIVEPLAYFNTLAASICLASGYFWVRKDYSPTTLFEFLTQRRLKKLMQTNNFDEQNYLKLKAELTQCVFDIKNNILGDL